MSLPKNVWSRSSLLAKMAGKIALKELQTKVGASPIAKRIEQAEEMVKTLSQMKGAAMKVGQLLSMDAADILPPEVVKVLGQLQSEAESIPFKEIESILKKELGESLFSQIEYLDPTPLAAASIGQVHRSRIKGREVVFKIQYPGVAETIDSDINLLEKISTQLFNLSGRGKISLKPLMIELKEVLKMETNYLQEAQFLVRYQKNFSGDSRFTIPQVEMDFTTSKVLCLEYCPGTSMRQWLEENQTEEDLERVSTLVLELYLKEFYYWGLVQTDPNFGNFLILENPIRLVLLDFGSTKEYSQSFIEQYKKIVRSTFDEDFDELLTHTYEMGFLDKRESDEAKQKYIEMMKIIVEPFLIEGKFDFTDSEFVAKTRDVSWEFTQSLKFSSPPKDLIFLHRKLGGVFGLMKKCKAKIALRPYMEDVLSS